MPHKCDRPRRAITKRASFRARSRGRGYDVINAAKLLKDMEEKRMRPSASLLMRLGLAQRHRQPVERRALGRGR